MRALLLERLLCFLLQAQNHCFMIILKSYGQIFHFESVLLTELLDLGRLITRVTIGKNLDMADFDVFLSQ